MSSSYDRGRSVSLKVLEYGTVRGRILVGVTGITILVLGIFLNVVPKV